jgi:hypothetical protein
MRARVVLDMANGTGRQMLQEMVDGNFADFALLAVT